MDKPKKYTYILYLIAFLAIADVVYTYAVSGEIENAFLLAMVLFSCGVGFKAISYMGENDNSSD